MENNPRIQMEKASKIIRKSIFTFLQNYHFVTTTAAIVAFPYSASILLSQVFVPSSTLIPTIHNRVDLLFQAAGFPPSNFFTILSFKISQTISSSIFALPFTLSFLLIAKSSVIQLFNNHNKKTSFLSLYKPLLVTYICNFLFLLSANATAFSLLSFAFNLFEDLGFSSSIWQICLSSVGAVLYSIILANALIICNLAMVSSGIERSNGYLAILKACLLIKGRTLTGLALAVPVNLILAAMDALFHYRVVKGYLLNGQDWSFSVVLEGVLIAYLYSIFVVLDTVMGCMFFKSCKTSCLVEQEVEGKYCYRIEIAEENGTAYVKVKNVEELP